MGFEDRLKTMNETETDNDVRDRIRTALQHFQQNALIVVGGAAGEGIQQQQQQRS
jgi:hypothetical protein